MSYDARVYRILIASPSDVESEREIVASVIQGWNDLHSSSRNVVLLPLRWETHTAPEYGTRPQEVINRAIIDECDLLVGIFWTRIGSPTGVADSGTLEEIERAGNSGKPVMLYFSRVPIDPEAIDLVQIDKLKAFKAKTYPKGLVESYKSVVDFRDKFNRQIEMKVRELQHGGAQHENDLSMMFVSPHQGCPLGNEMSLTHEQILVSCVDDVPVDIRENVLDLVQEKARRDSFNTFILAIENGGANGFRNLYVELTFKSRDGNVDLVEDLPRAGARASFLTSHLLYGPEEVTGEVAAARKIIHEHESDHLKETNDGWTLNLEWDALQSGRRRFVEPLLYVSTRAADQLIVTATIYSDSSSTPYFLQAKLNIDKLDKEVDLATFIPNWEQLVSKSNRDVKYSVATVNRLRNLTRD